MDWEKEFEKILQGTLERASSLKCSKRDYADGLQYIAEELLTAADAAEGEAKLDEEDQK